MRHQNCDLIDFFLTLSTRAVLISKQTIELLEKLQNLKSGIALELLLGFLQFFTVSCPSPNSSAKLMASDSTQNH